MNLPNAKTIYLYLRRSKSFEILIDGFSKTFLWFQDFIMSANISSLLSTISYFQVGLSNTVGVLINRIRQVSFGDWGVSASYNVVYSIRLIYENIVSFGNNISLSYIIRTMLSASYAMESSIPIASDITVALVNLLSLFDGDTLSSMDSQTLNDLDYSIA